MFCTSSFAAEMGTVMRLAFGAEGGKSCHSSRVRTSIPSKNPLFFKSVPCEPGQKWSKKNAIKNTSFLL